MLALVMTDISATPTVADLGELEKQAGQLDTDSPTCLALLGFRRTVQWKAVLTGSSSCSGEGVVATHHGALYTIKISLARVHCFFVNTTQRGAANMAANEHVNGHDADEFTNIADAYDTMYVQPLISQNLHTGRVQES